MMLISLEKNWINLNLNWKVDFSGITSVPVEKQGQGHVRSKKLGFFKVMYFWTKNVRFLT